MHVLATVGGVLLIAVVLVDAFETIVLPRRVTRRLRLTRLFLLTSWRVWSGLARGLPGAVGREGLGWRGGFLGVYGPLALLLLVGFWATALVVGFALLVWGSEAAMVGPAGRAGFGTILYASGITFFTIGFGDVTPRDALGRALSVAEGAMGFSFLAVIISYLPTIFAAFGQRETSITLLDARAGSPPSAPELLRRLGPDAGALAAFLREWERWSAELLDSHLAYPILSFFRSQHERQSWLAALTLVLDASALVIVGVDPDGEPLPRRQARLAFAMARHAAGDLCQVLDTPPCPPTPDRLPPSDLARLRALLAGVGLPLCEGEAADRQLAALRALYEPYVNAIAQKVLLALPPWLPDPDAADDWETTAWQWDHTQAIDALLGEAPARDPVASGQSSG